LFLALTLVATIGFVALGVWQLERRVWKLDLIARVDSRIHAPPAPLPPPDRWAAVNDRDDAYRRIRTTGTFLHDRETLVQALTERGAGFWVVTPFQTGQGVVLVNRGFVDEAHRDPHTRTLGQVAGAVTVTGLLRITEPRGGFLRSNQPASDRWYSRDVAAITARRGLGQAAPFFLDADATPNPGGWPVGGLTVVSFYNQHLAYALTWFGLALLSAFGFTRVLRRSPA